MSLDKIKKLREATASGIKECKKALEETSGDFNEALKILKAKGAAVLEKKSARATHQGLIDAYIHFGGNLGALVEVNCETDFVARTEVFKKFSKDIALHVAASNPIYVRKDDIPQDVKETIDNMDEFAKENCLLDQLFVKDNSLTVGDYLKDVVSQTGENVMIRRFARFYLGENEG